MEILGIGNAIVDVICKVDENFITENGLTKSTMKLIFDENEFKKLLSNLKIEKTVSGGSVANSIVGLSQLENKVGFIGKVNDDDLGNKYEEGLINENVKYFYSKKKEELPTGTCLILITPDSERTMCTFLGTAGKINENDIDVNAVKNSKITFLEGYLWDEGDPITAFDKAMKLSKKTAMTLSDKFCVDRHKKNFLNLVNNKLDITFANEQEILSLIDTKNFDEVVSFAKQLGKLIDTWFFKYGNDVVANLADALRGLGFKYATLSGISIAVDDMKVPVEKPAILAKAENTIKEIEKKDIDKEEKILQSHEIWRKATKDITDQMEDEFGKLNNVFIMARWVIICSICFTGYDAWY